MDFLNYNLVELYENIKVWHILLAISVCCIISSIIILLIPSIIRQKAYIKFKEKSNKEMEELKKRA